MAVVRYAKPGRMSASAWLLGLLERKPRKVAAVALANKIDDLDRSRRVCNVRPSTSPYRVLSNRERPSHGPSRP